MSEPIDVLVITGPVGAGKTTIAFAIATELEHRAIPHAVVDMDALRNVHPAPDDDPFGTRIGYRNLAAIWPNLREVEPRVVILADVVEHREQAGVYEAALPGTRVSVVRLDVPMHLVLERLDARETAATIEWYRHRAPELQALMEREVVGDFVIDVGEGTPNRVAQEILHETGIVPV